MLAPTGDTSCVRKYVAPTGTGRRLLSTGGPLSNYVPSYNADPAALYFLHDVCDAPCPIWSDADPFAGMDFSCPAGTWALTDPTQCDSAKENIQEVTGHSIETVATVTGSQTEWYPHGCFLYSPGLGPTNSWHIRFNMGTIEFAGLGTYNGKNSHFDIVCSKTPPPGAPTDAPTAAPTAAPTGAPTGSPTDAPTVAPTDAPTTAPTPSIRPVCVNCPNAYDNPVDCLGCSPDVDMAQYVEVDTMINFAVYSKCYPRSPGGCMNHGQECSGYGTCYADYRSGSDQCKCDPGWTGRLCSKPIGGVSRRLLQHDDDETAFTFDTANFITIHTCRDGNYPCSQEDMIWTCPAGYEYVQSSADCMAFYNSMTGPKSNAGMGYTQNNSPPGCYFYWTNRRNVQFNSVFTVHQELLDNTIYTNGVDPTYLVCKPAAPTLAPTGIPTSGSSGASSGAPYNVYFYTVSDEASAYCATHGRYEMSVEQCEELSCDGNGELCPELVEQIGSDSADASWQGVLAGQSNSARGCYVMPTTYGGPARAPLYSPTPFHAPQDHNVKVACVDEMQPGGTHAVLGTVSCENMGYESMTFAECTGFDWLVGNLQYRYWGSQWKRRLQPSLL